MNRFGLVPCPVSLQELPHGFTLTAATTLVATGEAAQVAELLAASLRGPTRFALPVLADASGPAIRLELDSGIAGEEAYRLRIDPAGATLSAATAIGLSHAMQTLLQLLPTALYAGAYLPDADWSLPGLAIEDAPRFPWRDLMLDSSRHFMPLAFVRRLIDLMALHKLNRFHWHLTDDQGWRVEIRKYPRLTEIGAWRPRTQLGHKRDFPTLYDDVPHGGFYTQDEIREIVRYAAERHIVVVPEIDMPGHVQSAIAAYPMLAAGSNAAVSDRWEISEHVLMPSAYSIGFMQDVLTEVMELFPSRYIHIGGDECLKAQWRRSDDAQALIRAHGLGDEDGLQSWFIRQIGAFLHSHGRIMIGWDEILEGGLADGAIVMCWRGTQGGIEAAKLGHDVIMTPQASVYLDYYQIEDHAQEPLAIRGSTTLETCYAYEPIPPELTEDEAPRVLGTGAKLWTEYVPNVPHAEYMLFPRTCAIAEVAWSPRETRDFQGFRTRMERHAERLAALGVNFRKLGEVS
jgi:hexosaminidase